MKAQKIQKVLISIPYELAERMKTSLPSRERSNIISMLIEKEVKKREDALYQAALELQKNTKLNQEIEVWENNFDHDGLDDESWDINFFEPTKEKKKEGKN